MSCKDTQNLIHGYIDGELDLARHLEIERHLQECPPCSQAFKNHQALRSAIHNGSLYFEPPANLNKRIRTALNRAGKTRTRSHRLFWRLMAAGALPAVIILLWVLFPVLTGSRVEENLAQEIISGHVRSLMADHLTDVSSSDHHTVKPWFNGKVDFSPQVEDLTDRGFPLVGGRLDYLGNRPVAALVYRHRQHLINLFIWPSTGETDGVEKVITRQGYNLIHWTGSGMNYWTVSDLNKGELQEFVRMVKDQTSPTTSP